MQSYNVKTGIQNDHYFWPLRKPLSKGPNNVNTVCQVWWDLGCKGKMPTNLGIQKGWGVGNIKRRDQGKFHSGVYPEDGWASEPVWRTEVNVTLQRWSCLEDYKVFKTFISYFW